MFSTLARCGFNASSNEIHVAVLWFMSVELKVLRLYHDHRLCKTPLRHQLGKCTEFHANDLNLSTLCVLHFSVPTWRRGSTSTPAYWVLPTFCRWILFYWRSKGVPAPAKNEEVSRSMDVLNTSQWSYSAWINNLSYSSFTYQFSWFSVIYYCTGVLMNSRYNTEGIQNRTPKERISETPASTSMLSDITPTGENHFHKYI